MLGAGGAVWVADEPARREFPPLRAGWSRRGVPATVRIRGRNGRRTIRGALHAATGELVVTVRDRCRTDDVLVAVEALGAVRPEVPTLLIWDNAPAHTPLRVRAAAHAANILIAFLPFRSPELMPLEDLWRGLTATVAANRTSASLEELAQRAVDWRHRLSNADRLRRWALQTSKFDWLST